MPRAALRLLLLLAFLRGAAGCEAEDAAGVDVGAPSPDAVSHRPTPLAAGSGPVRVGRAKRLLALRERVAGAKPAVIFLGDSLVERWEREGAASWNRHLAPLRGLNLGVAGDGIGDLRELVTSDLLSSLRPAAVVIWIGTNNTGMAEAQLAKQIIDVAGLVGKGHPGAHLLVLTLLPRGPVGAPSRARMQRINTLLERRVANTAVTLVDVDDAFEGTTRGLREDLLHLDELGYEEVTTRLRPVLEPLLSQPAPTGE